ncbi:Protein strawberry notch 2 [Saguinus oedipus]|uniref:Protein strawberry notch 2 n=1 Tax=Saguinus oedipus TaxID=9490 RepID=A0ABQ9WDV9_SAGOE|nr:Protein strawberry notch 2 [Saguinus oedipus]
MGKGRTVAGIILGNHLRGWKKALWFSVCNGLKYEAERDLRDIEAPGVAVHVPSKIKYGNTTTSEGVLFATYSALIGESQAGGQHRARLRQILDWCGEAFEGVIVFDECRKAKNAGSTKMGKAVLDLQNKLPLARVLYASATGASEPRNMIYMSHLGIWGEGTPFRNFEEFLQAVKRGICAMEIVALDMKVSGMYIARQLSFCIVTFRIEEIPLTPAFERVYNRAALLWVEALSFWSAQQRFFKYLCIAAKVRRLVELAGEELARDKCVVIGLQSTGEALTWELLGENHRRHLNCLVSTAEGLICISDDSSTESDATLDSDFNSSPKSLVDDDVVIVDAIGLPSDDRGPLCLPQRDLHGPGVLDRVERLKQDLLDKGRRLGRELPINTLDKLIDQLGGPQRVAEMTGSARALRASPPKWEGFGVAALGLRTHLQGLSGPKPRVSMKLGGPKS